MTFSEDRRALKAVIAILKKRFQNLSVEETVDLAADILEAVREADAKIS